MFLNKYLFSGVPFQAAYTKKSPLFGEVSFFCAMHRMESLMQSDDNKKALNSEKMWTNEQKCAIEDDGGTLLISAAAGSGKTAVLVERAVRLMTLGAQPVAADKILIVTFTNAAAQELRKRIGARLSQMIASQPKNINLRKQKLLLARANICTMHSFCLQLLQRNFTVLNLPADFSLADTADVAPLKLRAMEKTLEHMYLDDAFREFALIYGKTRSDEGAKNALLALYEFSRSLPNPQKAIEKIVEDYETNLPFGKTVWGKYLLKSADAMLKNAIALTENAMQCVQKEPLLSNYAEALLLDLNFYSELQNYIQGENWDEAQILLHNFKFTSLKAVKNYSGNLAQKVKALRDKAKDIVKKMQSNIFICTKQQYCEDLKLSLLYISALCKGANYYSETFFNIKLEEKLLEYSDLEHLALKLLSDEKGEKSQRAKELSSEIKFIMVDEYQDTNYIQEMLYKCLANSDESNLFFVGDVKQSIYKFRLAAPENFIEKREKFSPYGKDAMHPATIILGHNFRSSLNIINQINDVFTMLMSKQVGEISYDVSEQLKLGVHNNFDGGAFRFDILDESEDEAQQTDVEHVADIIADMLKQKYQVQDNGTIRDCKPEDFCILLRTRAKFPLYVAALNKREVPAYSDSGESYLTSSEVGVLLSMLRVIDNPGQDIHLSAVLLSALFGFSPDDLLQIRTIAPKGRLYSALLKSKDEKVVKFLDTLNYLRTLAISTNLFELCSEILNLTSYYMAVGASQNGENKCENINLFLSFTASFSHNTYSSGGLSAFLKRVESAIKNKLVLNASASPAKNCVSIMTIHRSKGLEFPIVILADTATNFNLTDTRNQFLFHPIMGAGLKLKANDGLNIYPSAMHASISKCAENEIKSEQMRLLYVALTRAKQKIIATASMKKPQKVLENLAFELDTNCDNAHLIQSQNTFAHWLCIAALLHKDNSELRKDASAQMLNVFPASGNFEAKIISGKKNVPIDEHVLFERKSLPSEELTKKINNNFAFAEQVKAENYQMPLKLSVTAISHKKAEAVFSRPAFTYKEGLTAAEQGTAMHEFLQFANFKNAKTDLKKEIKRLVSEKFISEIIAVKLNENKIEAFLNSKTAQRMMSAKILYREYDFITNIKAENILSDLSEDKKDVPITVQGIVDVVCINENGIEIIDYKTDKNKKDYEFASAYKNQLLLYKAALEKRFKENVVKCTIYSIENNAEIDVEI